MYEIINSLLKIVAEQITDRLERERAEQQINVLQRAIRRRDAVIDNYEELVNDLANCIDDPIMQHVSQRLNGEKPDESGSSD